MQSKFSCRTSLKIPFYIISTCIMSKNIIEVAIFKLKPGVSHAEYLEKFNVVLKEFLEPIPDFISIENLWDEKAKTMLNYVTWKSMEGAKKAMEKAMNNPKVAEWFMLMQEEGQQMYHLEKIS